jgi:phage portal protein BeeE
MSVYTETVRRVRSNADRARDRAEKGLESAILGGSGNSLANLNIGGDSKRSAMLRDVKGWIWTCLSAITKRVAGQPIGAGTLTNPADAKTLAKPSTPAAPTFSHKAHRTKTPRGTKSGCAVDKRRLPTAVKELTQGGREIEAFLDHDVLDFLAKPNAVQGKQELITTLIANLYIHGQAYLVGGIQPDSESKYGVELWAFPTTWITPKHEGKMFSSYVLKTPGSTGEGIPLPAEAVRRVYIPDPNDPKGCISPVATQEPAVKIDNAIQASQVKMFDGGGIIPKLAVGVGMQKGPDGKPTGMRQTLTGAQRRQIKRAIMEIMREDVSDGVTILDGLIDSITKIQNMPAEMDWLNSGKQVKERIFQAFSVNPIIAGEIAGVNRAQAAVAEQLFCSQVINPLVDLITGVLNDFVAPMFEQAETFVLWLEQATPLDEELDLRKWDLARRNGDVSRNEFRTNVLKLPPDETEAGEKPILLSTVGGMTGAVSILQAVGMGLVAEDSAVGLFMLFFALDEQQARDLVGSSGAMAALNAIPAVATEPDEDDEDDEDEETPEPPDLDEEEEPPMRRSSAKSGLPTITIGSVKAARSRKQLQAESEVQKRLVPFFPPAIARQLGVYAKFRRAILG